MVRTVVLNRFENKNESRVTFCTNCLKISNLLLSQRLIESRDPAAFYEYLRRTENTICGRNPILVFMHALQAASGSAAADDRGQLAIQWVKYDQSSHCETEKDSSVSYASAVVVPKK